MADTSPTLVEVNDESPPSSLLDSYHTPDDISMLLNVNSGRVPSQRIRFHESHTFLAVLEDDISRIPEDNSYTSRALAVCHRTVVQPYLKLMMIVALLPLYPQAEGWCYRIVNAIHLGFVVLVILFGYVISWAGCFGSFVPNSAMTYRWLDLQNASSIDTTTTSMINMTSPPSTTPALILVWTCTEYIVSRFVVLNILHAAAYVYSLYTLRIKEPEQLVSTMEKVFLFTNSLEDGVKEEAKMITRFRWLLFGGCIWILLSLINDALHVHDQYEFLHFSWFNPYNDECGKVVLICLMLLSFCCLNIVSVDMVSNYAVQCGLMMTYISGLMRRINENNIRLYDAMQHTGEILDRIRVLNHNSSVAVSLVLVNFLSYALLGIVTVLHYCSQKSWLGTT